MEISEKYLDNANIGILECNMSGDILHANSTAREILGLGMQDMGGNLFEISVDYRKNIQSTNETPFNILLEVRGEEITISNDIVNRSDAHLTIILSDISKNIKLEKEIFEAEEKLKTMLDVIPDIVYRVDKDGKIEFISDSISKYGYSQNELIGTNILDLIHPDDLEKGKRRILERRTGDRMTRFFELRVLTKTKDVINLKFDSQATRDSMIFSVCAQGVYKKNGKDENVFVGSQGVYRNISVKKQYEMAIRRSEEKWVSVMESIEDGYYETDLNGRVLYVNRALCEKLGYQKEELIGSNFSSYVDEDQKKKIIEYFSNYNENEKTKKLQDWTAIAKDGRKIIFQASASVIKTKYSGSIFYNGILRDISEKKKIEQELLMARKLEAIGILAGGIAHDYNNALTAIIGNLSLAKMDIDESNSDLFEAIADAENAALRVKDLTQQLSTFSKGGKPVKKTISVAPILKRACENLIGDSEYKYHLELQDDLWMVDADEFQIGHVFEYLIANAMESMEAGGEVKISVENVTVHNEQSHHEISLQPSDYLMITVSDEGCGIESSNIGKIFDPYYSTKEMASGMGLAISYAIIKRHKGYIDVDSEVGKGTSFRIYLPVNS